ncbi:hypothetical protein F5Y19DRAFT_458987 [Xylariaceae sp. FL1651]|nr:hypothetical protein F5Y19DRAFT_458987 [Xylariaceae sp. FL1651]
MSEFALTARILQGLSMSQTAESPPTDFHARLNDAGTVLAEISKGVDKAVDDSAQETVGKLETAMTKVYTAAVFIRGDYDNRVIDEDQKVLILQDAVSAFEQAKKRADTGLTTISDYHAKTVEVHNTKIAKIKDETSQMIDRNASDLRSIQNQIDATERNTQTLADSVNKQSQAIRELESKLPRMEVTTKVVDMTRFIPVVGIISTATGLINGNGVADPLGLHKQLDDARRSHNSAQNDMNSTNFQLSQLRAKHTTLEVTLEAQKRIQESLSKLQLECQEIESRCATFQARFAPLKDLLQGKTPM